jgi:hypothetical protein
MKIVNVTHWQARDLRRIACRVVREEFPRERFNDRAKRIKVYVKYNRGGKWTNSCSGHAQYNSNWCTLMVPSGEVSPADFAYVLGHELGHCKGLHHGHMPPHMEHRTNYARAHYAWAEPLTIRKQVIKKRERPTIDARLDHARGMLAKAQTRAKRATTIVKKWSRRVRELERRGEKLAAMSAQRKADDDGELPRLD